jgi:hypothetical protein
MKNSPVVPEYSLLVIAPQEGGHLSKLIDVNCNKIESYDCGRHVRFYNRPYTSFHKVLQELFEVGGETAFLLSGPTQFLEAELEVGHNLQRRLLKPRPDEEDGEPTVAYRDGVELSLDLDDIVIPDWNPLDPEPGIKHWLVENDIHCDITWQITAGQKLNSPDVRLRLYAELDKPYSRNARKEYSTILGADTSVYTATQPNYIAPPRIEGGKPDPIPHRHGFIKGKVRTLNLPGISEEQKKHYAPILHHYRKSESFPICQAQVLLNEGKMFRRVLVPLTMSLVNKHPNDLEFVLYQTQKMMDLIPVDKR